MDLTILDRLRQIAADVFEVPLESVRPTSSPDTVSSWDSAQHLNFVLAVEEAFDVQFEPEQVEQIRTIELAVLTVEELLSGQHTSRGAR